MNEGVETKEDQEICEEEIIKAIKRMKKRKATRIDTHESMDIRRESHRC